MILSYSLSLCFFLLYSSVNLFIFGKEYSPKETKRGEVDEMDTPMSFACPFVAGYVFVLLKQRDHICAVFEHHGVLAL